VCVRAWVGVLERGGGVCFSQNVELVGGVSVGANCDLVMFLV